MKNTALITGASSGIGRELAGIHAQHGDNLVLTARRLDVLNQLKEQLEKDFQIKVLVIQADLTLKDSPSMIYKKVRSEGIEPEYLINNAGFGGLGFFHEQPWQLIDDMMHLNMVALTQMTHLFLPDMVARGHGRILNVSSTASLMPGPLQAVYFATKAYVSSLSNALAEEMRGKGVTVTALLPGATATEFGRVSGADKTSMFNKTATAREVAEAGYRGMMTGRLNIIAGVPTTLKLMIKTIPFMPKSLVLKQTRRMQEE